MTIPGIPENNPQIGYINDQKGVNLNQYQNKINEYQNSIFAQCDTDSSGKLEVSNRDGNNEVKTFKEKVDEFIKNLLGSNNSSSVQGPKPTGTEQDVQSLTNQPDTNGNYNFDAEGNVVSDVTTNSDGSKTITSGNETLQVSKDGNEISLKDESGRNVSLTKTSDGGYEFTDEEGNKHKFDKDMNPM